MSAGFMFMAARYCKKAMSLMFFIIFLLLSNAVAVHGWRKLSKEEDLELDRQLKLINKPAVKSFRTEYGDILDCVDIYKQHAFDHPLLKNHTIQMEPETVPKGMKDKASSTEASSQFLLKTISCPQGTVPIRRTQKEDLIMAKYFKSFLRTYPTNIHSQRSSLLNTSTHHFAVLEYRKSNYGAKARINVWKPEVTADQFSMGSIWLVNGPRDQINSIQAGWMVHPPMYQNQTRLYIFWTADGYQKTGCFNLQCPGFIQVSRKITPDVVLGPVSAYDGPQYDLVLSLQQTLLTGNWWLTYGEDEYIGYWPKSIFTSLASGASAAAWGGEIYSPLVEASPSMGSGHFAEEGYGKSCYMSQIKVADSAAFVDPDDNPPKYADLPKCYNVLHYINHKDGWGHFIYFGGPGQCKLQ